MAIEVERRGKISEEKFSELKTFFDKNAKFLGEKNRFSIIYFQTNAEKAEDAKKDLIDLRLRITNKKPELSLKYGKWGIKEKRKEFSFPLNKEKFDDMVEFLKILGWNRGVVTATKAFVYDYKGIEFALVKVPGWGCYFEAEILTENNIKDAEKKVEEICKKLKLKIFSEKEMYKSIDEINAIKGNKFDFSKQDFKEIKKRFLDYF